MKIKVQVVIESGGKNRLRKGDHYPLVYRTLFGELRLRSVRLYHCACQPHTTRTFSPLAQLLSERTAPELRYLETKFASPMPYGLKVDILQEVLPLGKTINAATVRNNVHAVGQRIDKEPGEEKVFNNYDDKPKRRLFEVLKHRVCSRINGSPSYLMAQIRTRVLNDELREIFDRWYPTFAQEEVPLKKAA